MTEIKVGLRLPALSVSLYVETNQPHIYLKVCKNDSGGNSSHLIFLWILHVDSSKYRKYVVPILLHVMNWTMNLANIIQGSKHTHTPHTQECDWLIMPNMYLVK